MTDEKWEEKRPTIEKLREWDKIFLSMYAINLWDLTIKLEKALDKACAQLYTHYEPFDAEQLEKYHWNEEQWKEWCMNGEES